jgi:dolichol-phosphate mannosyltransferase
LPTEARESNTRATLFEPMSDTHNASISSPRYSIVVPCYNEEDCIVPLVEEIIALIGSDPAFELIIVDDCSSDRTAERLLAARQRLGNRFRIVLHRVNRGQSTAICTGVDVAAGAWIVTLDGDGQNDPADISVLIDELDRTRDEHGTPMLCGQRVTRRDSLIRRISSRTANAIRARLLQDGTPDTGCGLKLFHREAFLRLPRFDHMHRFLPALARREGAYVVSVPVSHRARRAGQSKYGIHNRLWVGIVDLLGVMWLARRRIKSTNHEER